MIMAHNKNCRKLLDTLSDYIDGDLAPELCAEIDRHIADCENCRVVVDTLKKTIYLYHETSKDVSIPADVRVRLYHRLDLDDFLEGASREKVD
jgi:anti-sigma factor (TIGR02949 family)